MTDARHVVIVGGGFAGLGCARRLAGRDDIRVTLIDKHNYHQFQPLFYQVATCQLASADVANMEALIEAGEAESSQVFATNLLQSAVPAGNPAGITGLAQINGLRGDTSIEDRARFDNAYIDDWSLWRDVCILLRTVAQFVRPTGS